MSSRAQQYFFLTLMNKKTIWANAVPDFGSAAQPHFLLHASRCTVTVLNTIESFH